MLGATSGSVTLLPPDFSRLRHALRGAGATSVATHFAVVCVPFGAGFAPTARNDGFPGTGVRREIENRESRERSPVTITGLTKNVAYAFAVVAFDASGVVINGVGAATEPVLAAHAVSSTCAWSRLAVVASRLGCAPIAARAAATVRRRFCVIDTHYLEKDENDETSSVLPRCPVTSQRLRRDVVRLAAPATLRAASRAMLVSAEAAAAARLEPFELEQFDAFLESDRAPLPELRVTKHREHLTRLDVAKRCVLAMELAGYAGDEALAQEACLRAGNFLAELFVSPGKKPRATLGLLNQACALLEECGKARTPAFARLAASIAHELVREARALGESAVLSRVARVTMTLDAMTPPLGARALSRSAVEETLLSFVEWRSFGAAALADRAEAAAADEARDPVAAVYAALGADATGSSPGASAGYEALANLLTPESLAEDPGPFARALCVALDAASARVEAGDASENSVGKTHAMVEEWATSVFAMCDESTAVPPTAFPESSGADDDYTGTPLEASDEARVAEIEATAEEARVVFDAGAPEEVATNADADIVAAHERATAEYEAAKVAVETAVAAREDACTRAASRERAARRLTRLLPPLFARRGAALQARPLVAALTPWRARACVALGRVAWEARETEVQFRTAGEPPVDPNSAETETPEKTESSEEQKALAVRAVTLLTRGVELGARAGCHHTIAAATRALYDLARSPVLGHEADARFAKGGGARYLAVAGGRVLEHLRRLKEDAENTARCARERDRETDLCASEEPDDDESAPLTSKGLFPETRAVFRKDSDPTSDLVSVAGGARVSPLAAAAAREKARRRASKKALAPENADSNARHAFKSLAVAFASENKPAFLDGGVTVWFASRPGIGIETLVRFVELAIEICVAAGFHRRASNLALELCDVVGTARVALDVLPKTLPSLRLCEAEDKEVGPARADAAESALRRARAEVPEHVATLRAARASLFPPDDPSGAGTKAPAEPRAVASRAKQTVSLYRAATRAASAAGDRPTASQAQLELGDALCAAGELEEATRAWGSCLDGVVGRYDVAFDASGGGCRSLLPSTPEATLGMFGLRGCLRAANAAARLATRAVRKPFRAADVHESADDADDDDADVKHRTSALGVGARVEIARVASRFLEAASRASLGDARFFGGGFCGFNEPDAASAASASPGPETDVSWETIGDGVVDGWDAFLFDARATCDDALAVSDLLLRAGRAPESAAAASLAEALAARRLRDFRRVVDARLKRSAAMADIGALGVSAALLLTAVEGTDLPSIAGGAAGRTLAPPPPRGVPAENGEDGEDADATPTSPPGPPRFADDEPLWSARNARAASYVATVSVAEAVSAAYGEPLAEAVELARARWLLAAAAAAAPKARGVDVETDAVFFAAAGSASDAAAPGGEGGGGGDADSSETSSYDPGGRDDALASAKSTLLSVLDRARGAIEAAAARAQEEVDAAAARVDEEAAAARARREARDAAAKARREAREAADAKKAFDGDWSDAEPDEDAEKPPDDDEETRKASDTEADAETDASSPNEKTKDFEPCAPEKGAHEWLMASPEQLALLLDASLLLSQCLRLRRDVAGARRVACEAAEKADALAAGFPNGERAANAARVAARVGASRRVALRVASVEAGVSLGLDSAAVRAEANAALRVANAFGDEDAARRLRFAAARAAAAGGDARAAESALESLLVECAPNARLGAGGLVALRGPRCSPAAPPASASLFAAVARRLARLKQRRGDHAGAARALAPAAAAAGRAAAARGGFGARPRRSGAAGSDASTRSERVRAHALATACFVATATRWAECALAARGAGADDASVLSGASRALRDAARAARLSATVPAAAEARVATRAAFAATSAVAERHRSRDEALDVSELEDILASLRRAGRLALSPAAGHDVRAARAAALELFSTTTLRALLDDDDAQSRVRFRNVFLRLEDASPELEKNETKKNASAFLASCAACLRASHRASAALAAAGDATRRAEVAASLALAADAVPPAAAARAEAEEAARSAASGETFGVSGDADADTLARRVLASRCRAAFLYDAWDCLDDDGDARSGGDAGETLAFLGETHVTFKRASETYVSTLGFAETPACFREPSTRASGSEGEDADAEAEEEPDVPDAAAKESRAPSAGSVLAQWRAPIAPPVSFRADRRTKNASPLTLALIVATTKTTPETPETTETTETTETSTETSTTKTETTASVVTTRIVGEICLDAAAVRRAQRAVREARAAALAVEPKRSADDPADDPADVASTDADAASTNAANAKTTAKATEMAKRATAAVVSLFATKQKASAGVASENAPSLVKKNADAEPNKGERPPLAFPTTFPTSFLETLEAFVSPELGVVAEDDAEFAAFVEAAVSGRFSRDV